jgi:hypothetical protein
VGSAVWFRRTERTPPARKEHLSSIIHDALIAVIGRTKISKGVSDRRGFQQRGRNHEGEDNSEMTNTVHSKPPTGNRVVMECITVNAALPTRRGQTVSARAQSTRSDDSLLA